MNRTARAIAGVAAIASAALASLGATTASAASCVPGGAPAPAVLTNAATAVTPTGASLHATVDPNGCATTYSFDYGTTTTYGSATTVQTAGTGTNLVPVTVPVTGLAPKTLYHFKIVATSGAGTTSGSDMTLTTPISCAPGAAAPPSALTTAATGVTATRATLSATIDPNGCATKYSFQYGTSTQYTGVTSARSVGAGTKLVSATAAIARLAPRTVYHFRIVATSTAGTTAGSDMTLTTLSACAIANAPPPSVVTSRATAVRHRAATLTGSVNPNGCSTKYLFEYGTTTQYTNFTAAHQVGAGTQVVPAALAIAKLSEGTLYHFRLLATSAAGTTIGHDVTLRTASAPTPSRVRIVDRRSDIVRGFIARITLRCFAGSENCSGILKIFRNHRSIGLAHFSLRAHRKKVVRVTLNHRGRQLMHSQKRLHVRVVAYATHNKAVRYVTVIRRFTVK